MYWQTDGLTSDLGNTFQFCENLTTFASDLSSLVKAFGTFDRCSNLTTFTSDLSSLTDGTNMFNYCTNLTTFTSDLSSLAFSTGMFSGCSNLTTFTSDLSSFRGGKDTASGNAMFAGCNLTSFSSNLSNMMNGMGMFIACTNLTSFSSDLSSLIYGDGIFDGCKLDAKSVANIVHTLPHADVTPNNQPVKKGNITIGIGCDDTEEDRDIFAQECSCETWQELLDDFSAKNWTVTFQYNGRPTTTYNMRRGETLPIYAKLEEVTDEKYYQYTSADGSKFYNINYFHSTNGSTEGYDVFSSLEEAINSYGITPKN
jgi:hypothetical protein